MTKDKEIKFLHFIEQSNDLLLKVTTYLNITYFNILKP